jgi:hypothetical protein
MADKKISALTGATTPLAGTEVLPIVQSGSTVKVAVSDLTAGRATSALSYTSTATTGTAPFTVSSTTNVANLNASSLNGATFASPGAIGGTSASSGAFTTITPSDSITPIVVTLTNLTTAGADIFTGNTAYSYNYLIRMTGPGGSTSNFFVGLYFNSVVGIPTFTLGLGGCTAGGSTGTITPNADEGGRTWTFSRDGGTGNFKVAVSSNTTGNTVLNIIRFRTF